MFLPIVSGWLVIPGCLALLCISSVGTGAILYWRREGHFFGPREPCLVASGAAYGPAAGTKFGRVDRVGCRTMGANDLHETYRYKS